MNCPYELPLRIALTHCPYELPYSPADIIDITPRQSKQSNPTNSRRDEDHRQQVDEGDGAIVVVGAEDFQPVAVRANVQVLVVDKELVGRHLLEMQAEASPLAAFTLDLQEVEILGGMSGLLQDLGAAQDS
jgi:hypothetical protein